MRTYLISECSRPALLLTYIPDLQIAAYRLLRTHYNLRHNSRPPHLAQAMLDLVYYAFEGACPLDDCDGDAPFACTQFVPEYDAAFQRCQNCAWARADVQTKVVLYCMQDRERLQHWADFVWLVGEIAAILGFRPSDRGDFIELISRYWLGGEPE